jgi:hypothetical protein
MRPADFPLGSPESRAAARMQAQREQNSLKRIEIIWNVPRPQRELSPGTDNYMPHASPWQRTTDGGLMRIVYCPGEWKELPVEDIPRCSGCGTPFRRAKKQLGNLVWFTADCVAKHVSA